MVALRRRDVQYRCSKVSRLRQRVDGCGTWLRVLSTRLSALFFCTNMLKIKAEKAGRSRVYVTLGIIFAQEL